MNAYTGSALAILILIHIACGFALAKRRNDYADVVWGPGFLVGALGTCLALWSQRPGFTLGIREWLILGCVAVWGFRLFFHIGLRSLSKSVEDSRYLNWRRQWGNTWVWRSYVQVFLLQGCIMWVIASPQFRALEIAPRKVDLCLGIGLLIWTVGFFFESVSDAQLARFTSDPKNKDRIMDRGLWSWSRHPNYFGEVTQWWGIFVMAVDPQGWWTVISPIAITFFILKVSGVPMLEKLMEDRPGFAAYKDRTSMFFPRPPNKQNH